MTLMYYTHGASKTTEYRVWKWMRQRCYTTSSTAYPNYGGRGIKVCDRWSGPDGFQNFLSDMGPRPSSKHTIERIDNDKDYSPDNCKWATHEEQSRNHRRTHFLTYQGETLCILDWSIKTGISRATIYYRLRLGWPIEKVLTPMGRSQRNTERALK